MPETKQEISAQIASALGLRPSDAKPLTPEEKTTLYSAAYSLYNQGDYSRALQLFTHLVLNSPFCERSWRGLASTRQMSQDYKGSLHAWALTALLQDTDPSPHFHAAECYFSLGDRKEALLALDAAESLLSKSEEDLELKNKITILRNADVPSH